MLRSLFLLSLCGLSLSLVGVRQQNAEAKTISPKPSGTGYACINPHCQTLIVCDTVMDGIYKSSYPKPNRKKCGEITGSGSCYDYGDQQCQFETFYSDPGCNTIFVAGMWTETRACY